MDSTVVKNAIGSLEKLLGNAKEALWDIEREEFGVSAFPGEPGGYEYPRDALKNFLEELHDILLVVLEAAGMTESRTSLVNAWPGFANQGGLRETRGNAETQTCESLALTFLERLIQGLRISVSEAISSEEARTLNRLEGMLRDTAALVHRRKAAPANEADLQYIMHDYLSACFPDFTKDPSISGTLKKFKPDCGIASVRAAVEFKIVHDKDQVATAFSGVTEDTAGYKGSKDWTRFYAVIYQAEPFMLESHLRSDLKRIGAATWTPIVVNGPTTKNKNGKKNSGNKKLKASG
jgi:REase_DpnII-MboI